MSKKTMKQRIALVAVSALTAGVLSVMSAPVANAAAGDHVDEGLALQTLNSATGLPVMTDLGGNPTLDRSVGIVAITSALRTGLQVANVTANSAGSVHLLAGATGTAVALQTSKLVFGFDSASKVAVSVTGGTITAVASELAGSASIVNGLGTALVTSAVNKDGSFTVTPNAGATSLTVSAWQGANVTELLPSNGTLMGTWSITLAAAAATSTFSPSLSLVALGTSTAEQITSSVDASTGSAAAGTPYYIQVIGKNPYNEALAAGTYVATATNGALLNWGDSAAGASIVAGTLSVATKTPDGTDQLRIDPASSLTTTSTTVTITHDGTPVATKTMTFYGEAKKIVIEKVVPGTIGTAVAGNAATAYAIYSYRDSADGKVPGTGANFVATAANSTIPSGQNNRAPSRSTGTATATTGLAAAQVTLIGAVQDGVFALSCGSTPAKAKAVITHTNSITGTVLTADINDVGCYGPINTYTVSTDKAKYAVGEVATITVEGKDSLGNPVSDAQLLGANVISVGGGTLTTGPTGAADVFTAGKASYKAQLTTAGTFNVVVSIAGITTTSATAGYSVTSGDVSNAEVLKSIVALIASINKQIAALQKLILRR